MLLRAIERHHVRALLRVKHGTLHGRSKRSTCRVPVWIPPADHLDAVAKTKDWRVHCGFRPSEEALGAPAGPSIGWDSTE